MKELFADATFGMIGLLFFFAFFIGLMVWLFRPGAKREYDDAGQIPLKEDDKNE